MSVSRNLAAGFVAAAMFVGLAAPAAATPPPIAATAASPAVSEAQVFKHPIKPNTYRMTSSQGPRCIPVIGGSTFHQGQDMGAPDGTPIYAVADGTVRRTSHGTSSRSGFIVVESNIDGKRYDIAYIHMWNATTHVQVGDEVKAGQQVSRVGNSGPSTGAHLHFEIWDGPWMQSRSVDPVPFLEARGVDLNAGATSINPYRTPSTCTYYAANDTSLYSTATSSTANRTVYTNAQMTSQPGTMVNGRVPVTVAGVFGWVDRYAVSPRPVQVATKIHANKIVPGTYTTTANLNLRQSAPSGAVLKTLPQGADVTATGRTGHDGSWYEVKHAGTAGWASEGHLRKAVEPVSSVKPTPAPTPVPTPASVPALKPAPKAAPATPVTKATYTATANLHLRQSPNTGKILATMKKGATVVPTGKASNGWIQVKSGSKTGWSASAYLTKASAKAPAPVRKVAKTTVKTVKVNLNLRALAGTNHRVLTVLRKNTKVTYHGTSKTGWAKIGYQSKTGYVNASYLN